MRKLFVSICICILFFACRPSSDRNTGTNDNAYDSSQVAPAVSSPGIRSLEVPSPPPKNITIASFNVQILGQSKLAKPNVSAVIASIIARFDIVALEEVGSNSSASSNATCTSIMDAFVSRVNELSFPVEYAYVRGDQYAIIYRTDTVRLINSGLYSGAEKFTYTPMTAYFSAAAGNFDFTIITIHTSPPVAEKEIPSLKTAMTEVSLMYNEPDVICLGDYNGDGAYYAEGPESSLAGFEDCITGIPNEADTTAAPASNTYDRIEMTNSMKQDYANSWGVLVFSQLYDLTACEGSVSDHYPVYCEYYTDRDTD